jgi:hypothetical protein
MRPFGPFLFIFLNKFIYYFLKRYINIFKNIIIICQFWHILLYEAFGLFIIIITVRSALTLSIGLNEYNCILGDSGKSVGLIVVLSYVILSLSSTLCLYLVNYCLSAYDSEYSMTLGVNSSVGIHCLVVMFIALEVIIFSGVCWAVSIDYSWFDVELDLPEAVIMSSLTLLLFLNIFILPF